MQKRLNFFKDKRGSLFVFEKDYFNIKRVFVINGKNNSFRGNHAHKDTVQILININSKSKLYITKSKTRVIKFTKPGEYFICPTKSWLKISFIKEGSIMVLCNKKYSKKDYINKFDDFKKLYS
jgi:hypothetical protein|tara:strand:+ start:423 stop:791 length:369 start_codon:yes stop_codon:yes gene_type:complete